MSGVGRRQSTFLIVLLYAVLAVIVVPIFPHFTSTTEFSRWAVAASVVDHGTVEVTRLAPLLGPSDDLSEVDGRLYSNKAPGGALIGLPAYALRASALLGLLAFAASACGVHTAPSGRVRRRRSTSAPCSSLRRLPVFGSFLAE